MEPRAALGGAVFEGPVTVREAAPRTMIAIRADLSGDAARKAVAKAAGLALPGTGEVVQGGERALFWMSPDELLLCAPRAEQGKAVSDLEAALAGTHALVADVSDARAVFTLDGEAAAVREVLAKLSPADLHPDALPPLRLRRTRLAQVPAAFWIAEDGAAEVIAFRSVAAYVFGLLKTAAEAGPVGHFG